MWPHYRWHGRDCTPSRCGTKAMKLVLNDDTYTVEIVGEQTDEGTFSVDPEKSPKEMDI